MLGDASVGLAEGVQGRAMEDEVLVAKHFVEVVLTRHEGSNVILDQVIELPIATLRRKMRLDNVGYGVPALAMRESPNLPPMHCPNGPMGLDQLGEVGYAAGRKLFRERREAVFGGYQIGD